MKEIKQRVVARFYMLVASSELLGSDAHRLARTLCTDRAILRSVERFSQ